MDKLYFTLGVSGVGKGKIVEGATKDTDITAVNLGDIMTQLMIQNKLIQTRDDIRAKVDQKTWIEYQILSARNIGSISGKVLVDTHACIPSHDGYLPGLPPHILNNLPIKPSVIFLVKASPEDIHRRRTGDSIRRRNYDFESGPEKIREYQEEGHNYARIYSAITGARLKIVQNNNGGLEKVIKEVRDTLLRV